MAWQVGVAQTMPLICYLDGVETAPSEPLITEVNVAGAGFVPTTNPATDEGNGAVSVALEAAEVGAWGFVRVVGANGAVGLQAYTAEGDWTAAKASKLNVSGTLAHSDAADLYKADVSGLSTLSEAQVRALIDEVKGAGWTNETLVEIMGAIQTFSGTGAFTVTLTLSDGAGRLAGGLAVAVRDSAGNTVAGPLATNTSGRVTYYLDAGDYAVVTPSTTMWQGSSTPLTVTGDATIDITVGTRTIPLPSAPDKYVVIINAADEHDVAVGAAGRTYRVVSIYPPNDPTNKLLRATEENPLVTDANGQASFEIGQSVTGFALRESYTDAAGKPVVRVRQFTVHAGAANAEGYIYAADIEDAP